MMQGDSEPNLTSGDVGGVIAAGPSRALHADLATQSGVVETTNGKVQGLRIGGVESYKNIPFAGDTGGRNRFRAAPEAAKWTGVRDATQYGPGFPQGSPFGPEYAPVSISEDASTVNVWTPSAERGAKRPVLFWIFGGGFVAGTGTDTEYDGTYLAQSGDVVVVTFNYRVGALGGLYLGGFSEDYAQGNVMFLDQIAALTWVRDNIDAFGGDPGNVTIFGQSAGGHSCGDLLAVPQARGLFHKASPQSGADFRVHTREEAEEYAVQLLRKLEIAPAEWQRIFDVPWEAIVEHQLPVSPAAMWKDAFSSYSPRPMIDGHTLHCQPHLAIAAGSAAGIPVLIGTNEYELAMWAKANPQDLPVEQFEQAVRSRPMVAQHADRLIAAYANSGSGAQRLEDFMRDLVFGIPATRLADAQSCASEAPVYSYLFSWESPVPGVRSSHHAQVPFEFGTIDLPKVAALIGTGPGRREMTERLSGALVAFARTGDPSHPGIPTWRSYSTAKRETMIIDTEWSVESDPLADRRRAWNGVVYGSLMET